MGALGSSLWRLNLMPVDTFKTMMQVHGKDGFKIINQKIKTHGFPSLYHGYFGTISATMLGYYPWFFTFGYLDKNLEPGNSHLEKLCRNATIGFCASFTSDIISNSARVLKTSKQTDQSKLSYLDHAKGIIKKEGIIGLATRGLATKILSNGIQSATFTVLWKYLENLQKTNSETNQSQ